MVKSPRLRGHTAGRLAVQSPHTPGWWLVIRSAPDDQDYWVRDDEANPVYGDGWSELAVFELPEPDGWTEDDDGSQPQWEDGPDTLTAWPEGVHTDHEGLTEVAHLDHLRVPALKTLAVCAASERMAAQREAGT